VYMHDNCGSKGLFWLAAILQGAVGTWVVFCVGN
ncbi:hypothetical protein A2U01_0096976, partial [Trifolium medium]|nr:hypothetical protein [Trifolium medium]